MAAIFFVSSRPPVWQMSGCAMWKARVVERLDKVAPPDQSFSGGDGHALTRGEMREPGDVLGRKRLFDEHRAAGSIAG